VTSLLECGVFCDAGPNSLKEKAAITVCCMARSIGGGFSLSTGPNLEVIFRRPLRNDVVQRMHYGLQAPRGAESAMTNCDFFAYFTGSLSIMNSALGALVCVATVYAGCSWFVARNLDDSHVQAAADNGGWATVSEPTLESPYLQARRPEAISVEPFGAKRSPTLYDDPAYRGASPWLARARNFNPSSL